MLTLLRKIRRSLIESGATRKYLLYALGEFLLIVAGILFALQINNGKLIHTVDYTKIVGQSWKTCNL